MGALVTGTGGVGTHVARRLVDEGIPCTMYGTGRQMEAMKDVLGVKEVGIFKGDVLDLEALSLAVKGHGVDRIIHTAGPRATPTRKDPKYGVMVHLTGTANVLEAARRADVKMVVFASSASVYLATKEGQYAKGPIKEEDPLVPMDHEDVYATAKLACEYLGFNYAKAYGLGFVTLRMAHVYGPWLGDMGRGSAIRDMVKSSLLGGPLEVEEQIAEWTYLKDLVEEYYLAAYSGRVKSGAFNAGSGRISSLKEVLEVLRKYVKTANVKVKEEIRTHRRVASDLSMARERLGYEPKYDLDKAVRELIEWWRPKLGIRG